MGVLLTNEDNPDTMAEKLSMKNLGFLILLNKPSNKLNRLKLSFRALVMKMSKKMVMMDSFAA